LPLLVFRQNFRETGIGFFLQFVDLLALLIGEFELVLKGSREKLSRVKSPPRATASRATAKRAASSSRWPVWRAVTLPRRRQFRRIAGQHRRELVASRCAVLVGVRPLKQRFQTHIGQLRF
jgi:hypothetical protein